VKTTILKCEYIWLDGNETQTLRSKTRVLSLRSEEENWNLSIKDIPTWTFDGSSTNQADTSSSDLVLRPVFACIDSNRENGVLVLCDVLNPDMTPHETNHRAKLIDTILGTKEAEPCVGFEQEYFLYDGPKIMGWADTMRPQGPYYCGVGADNVAGRNLVELHLSSCINSGLSIVGVNAEVALGQWEYQVGGPGVNVVAACDHLWVSRFILQRICELQEIAVSLDPKPVSGDWNGSGMHTNFSTKSMREAGGISVINRACEIMGEDANIQSAIKNYGEGLERRLTGRHETASINEYSFGVADRASSIRIPLHVSREGCGYLEDRRPNSNADPYRVTTVLVSALGSLG